MARKTTVQSGVNENLLGCHVVAVENGGIGAVVVVETQIFPVGPLFSGGRKSAARARAAGAAGRARRARLGATGVEAARAAVGAYQRVAVGG